MLGDYIIKTTTDTFYIKNVKEILEEDCNTTIYGETSILLHITMDNLIYYFYCPREKYLELSVEFRQKLIKL